jgi:hypothetical protein
VKTRMAGPNPEWLIQNRAQEFVLLGSSQVLLLWLGYTLLWEDGFKSE